APESERPEIELSPALIRRHRLATLAAFMIWFVTVTATLVVALQKPELSWLPYPLWIVACTPLVLLAAAQRRKAVLGRNRMGKRRWWFVPVVFGGFIALWLVLPRIAGNAQDPASLLPGLGFVIITQALALLSGFGVVIWLLWMEKRRKLRSDVVL